MLHLRKFPPVVRVSRPVPRGPGVCRQPATLNTAVAMHLQFACTSRNFPGNQSQAKAPVDGSCNPISRASRLFALPATSKAAMEIVKKPRDENKLGRVRRENQRRRGERTLNKSPVLCLWRCPDLGEMTSKFGPPGRPGRPPGCRPGSRFNFTFPSTHASSFNRWFCS